MSQEFFFDVPFIKLEMKFSLQLQAISGIRWWRARRAYWNKIFIKQNERPAEGEDSRPFVHIKSLKEVFETCNQKVKKEEKEFFMKRAF